MAKRRKQMLNACDTCGAIGYLKELVFCCHCKNAFRHRKDARLQEDRLKETVSFQTITTRNVNYCMYDMHFDVTMPWHCDDCTHSLNVDQEQEEIMFGNKYFDAEDNNRMKTLLPLRNEDQVMANKLTSKASVNSSKNDKQSNTGVSGTTRPTNKKVTNASTYSASLSKDSDAALPSQNMASLPNPKYSKEKLANYHDQPCWKGTFEILDGNFLLPPYQGLRAHLSFDANPRVVNFCKSLSEKLEFKELPLSKVWPKIFMLEPPNTDDVALYFFCDTGRPREKYIRLVQRLDSRDHALKAKMKGAQLLLFSSKKLPPNSQKTKHVSYLWGIIRFPKSKVVLKSTNARSTDNTPKTKKQIRFDLSNLPPEKRSADISINAKTNVSKSCLVKEPCLNQSENTTKSLAKVNSLGKQENEANGVFVGVDTKFDKVKDKVDYHSNEVDPDLPPGFSNFVSSKQQMNVQLQIDSEKCDVLKNKDIIDKVTNISPDPDIPPGFSYPSSASDNLTDHVQLRTDCDKGNIIKNNGTINKLTNVNVDPDIPPGFSYPLSAFVKSSLNNTANNHTDQGVPGFSDFPTNDICTETSFPLLLKPKEVDMSIENASVQTENSDMSIDSEDAEIENNGMPNVDMSFNNSTIKKDLLIPNIGTPPGFHPKNDLCTEISFPLLSKSKEVDMSIENVTITMKNSDMSVENEGEKREDSDMPVENEDEKTMNVAMPFNSSAIKKDLLIPNIGTLPGFLPKNDICTETSFPLLSKSREVDMSIENVAITTMNSDMSIENEGEKREDSDMPVGNEDETTMNVAMPFNSRAIKKDLLISNIGPPPGFPEIPIKLAKCIVGAEMSTCFSKTERYMESIGAPPGFSEIAVKRHFALPIECCECLQGVKNGTCAVESDVKVDKVNIKRETCLEDIIFVKPNFVLSPPSKGATSTMIKCQNASIVCAKVSDSENKSRENPNSKSPLSSTNKENNFISPNSAEECNKSRFTMENGCKSYDNDLSWMNKTMKIDVPNDAENGTFRSNAKAQSENSGKIPGKNMFGVKFSLKKTEKPSAPAVPTFFENPSNTDSEITPNSFQKTHVADTYEDGLFGHTQGNRAARDKQATEEKNSRSSRPLTEQCLKNHYISKNPALSVPASSAEKARDHVSSRTTNPESVSEVKRILLEVKKFREHKGKL